jgi:hypothetical protein
MPRSKRKPVPVWDVPAGWFTEPVRKWFPDWRPRTETAADRAAVKSLRLGISASAVRDRALERGEWWATGFLGQLSARPLKVDTVTSRKNAVAGLKQKSGRELRKRK